MSTTLFLVAGEPSGDRLGAALMAGLKHLRGDLRFIGIGGPLMQAEGLRSIFPMEDLSLMGLSEILPHLRHLFRRLSETVDAVGETGPAALITIDIPEFSLRLSRRVKSRWPGLRTIHYVAPTVWAWRPGRARRMARHVDHVLALFPFEPPLMQAAGMGCDFVGHPVASEPVAETAEIAGFRTAHGLSAEAPTLLLLPGSRQGEIRRLAPVFSEVLERLRAAHPDLQAILPAAPAVAPLIEKMVDDWPVAPLVLDPRDTDPEGFAARKRAAFAAADLALAASGTVSLELAAAATPMVIAYDMNWASRLLVRSLMRIDTVTLVNLVSETRAVPEYLGAACRPGPVAAALEALLADGDARLAQLRAMALCMDRLGRGGEAPGLRAARAVLALL